MMTDQEMGAAGCIELALEAKMTDCMSHMDWWRRNKPVSGDEKWRKVSVRYWQDRLRSYFFAAVLACDAGVTDRTPEEMLRAAALNFAYIKGARRDA